MPDTGTFRSKPVDGYITPLLNDDKDTGFPLGLHKTENNWHCSELFGGNKLASAGTRKHALASAIQKLERNFPAANGFDFSAFAEAVKSQSKETGSINPKLITL